MKQITLDLNYVHNKFPNNTFWYLIWGISQQRLGEKRFDNNRFSGLARRCGSLCVWSMSSILHVPYIAILFDVHLPLEPKCFTVQ